MAVGCAAWVPTASREVRVSAAQFLTAESLRLPGLAHGLGRAVTSAGPVFGVQTPRFGSTGEDFAVVRKLQ